VDAFAVAIRPPTIEMPLLKRLGEPAFVSVPGIQSLLRLVYYKVSQAAQEAAYADTGKGVRDK
jgi:hypothetical protein